MPNRLIKESICTSDNLNNLSKDAEILFYRLIVNCDDYGLLDARPSILISKCFPLKARNIDESTMTCWLNELSNSDLILLYSVKGKPYLKMKRWESHQQIRAKKSKYPMPDINCNQMISDDSNSYRNPIQSNPNPNPNIESNPITGEDDNLGESQNCDMDEFECFWNAYPRQYGKDKALKEWKLRIIENVSSEDLIKAASNYSKYCIDQEKEEQFIKYPSTFLGKNKAYEEFINWEPKPKKQYNKNKKVNSFSDYSGQREYDPVELRKQLLGRELEENEETSGG